MKGLAAAIGFWGVFAPGSSQGAADLDSQVPHYSHIFVIVEENKDFAQILNPAAAPHITALAKTYGDATAFYSETHPSEANYVAMLGGDTFGIHDDDAFYCKPGPSKDAFCTGSTRPGYPDHTVHAPHLGGLLEDAGLTWKGYYENLPKPGALAVTATDPAIDDGTRTTALYASKHSGFLNFASVQADPNRADHVVSFDQLTEDLKADVLPTFALIVPNQCNEMHGLHGPKIPLDCDGAANLPGLIRRGDATVGRLVQGLQRSKAWGSRDNVAIVVTFDEGSGGSQGGCCGTGPEPSNAGGGHIPTIVITNHGPRGVIDDTPYSHYSLLRTLQDALGVRPFLGHAADGGRGVVPMVRLFATHPTT